MQHLTSTKALSRHSCMRPTGRCWTLMYEQQPRDFAKPESTEGYSSSKNEHAKKFKTSLAAVLFMFLASGIPVYASIFTADDWGERKHKELERWSILSKMSPAAPFSDKISSILFIDIKRRATGPTMAWNTPCYVHLLQCSTISKAK